MTTINKDLLRTAVLTTIVDQCPSPPGRTTLMKYAYLLQAVRGVPLGYRFQLYNYGPYDESVLSDIRQAVSSDLLTSKLVTFSGGGYGYQFSAGAALESSREDLYQQASDFEDDIDWVINEFGDESAGRMELISTIVFVLCDNGNRLEKPQIIQRVHEIKPHFSREVINAAVDEISEVLNCVNCR
ncbi:MAG TPA: hypothetical protein PLY87_29290 [Planctomycetaceae bacterium]|nr:hypothetical protein [Planctomycetaceae bacterium]